MKATSKFLLASLIGMTALAAAAGDPYKVRVELDEDDNGAMVFLVNHDTSEKIDSVIVADKVALFKGEIDEPIMASVVMDGMRIGRFILENGSIVIDITKDKVFGSMLNDVMDAYEKQSIEISNRFRASKDDDEREAIYGEYVSLTMKTMTENVDNPLGLMLFLEMAPSMELAEFDEFLAKYPDFAKSKRVNTLITKNRNKAATSVGNKFVDFSITYNGETKRLSDYVGKGKYVLVDFWASWCGPCRRQIPVIKQIISEFGDSGLDVLGVAVWDKPEDTLKAIESHEITWPNIIDAQTIPTDIYGISGIPCIMLFGPDGTILSRDKQSEELISDVRSALQNK